MAHHDHQRPGSPSPSPVGKRISVGAHRGTIRYAGPVPPATGEWLGVEWDDPLRGKHDGVAADGTRYFDVRIPGSGSFIRPTASKLSYGSSFLQALEAKYLPSSNAARPAEGEAASTRPTRYSRRNLADIEIEAPNMDGVIQRTARLERLRQVGLGGWKAEAQPPNGLKSLSGATSAVEAQAEVAMAFDVARGEEPGSIRRACANIQWLDLSMSLLADWDEVAKIAAELDRLDCLILNFNRFAHVPRPGLPPSRWTEAFSSVTDLRLDGTLIGWDEMVDLSPAFPSLELLQLGQNGLTSLATPTRTDESGILFPRLGTLILEDNLISSWSDIVDALHTLPRLANLYLTKNLLQTIPRYSPGARTMPSLEHVGLCKNPIADWETLENLQTWIIAPRGSDEGQQDGRQRHSFSLNILPLDQDAQGTTTEAGTDREEGRHRLHASALVETFAAHDFRALAIARLAHLGVLDRTPVSPRERRDAELYVLGKVEEGSPLAVIGTRASEALGLAVSSLRHDEQDHGDARETLLSLTAEQKRAVFPRYDELRAALNSTSTPAGRDPAIGDKDDMPKTESATQAPDTATRGTLKSKLIELHVVRTSSDPSASSPLPTSDGPRTAKLPSSTPLRLAKIKFAKLAGVKPFQILALWAVLSPEAGVEGGEQRLVELEDATKDLAWYGLASGDRIVVILPPSATGGV